MPVALMLLSGDATISVLASSGLDNTSNGTIAFHRSRWLKSGTTWLCVNFIQFALASVSYAAKNIINSTIAYLRLRTMYCATDQQHDFFGHVMPLILASVSHDSNGVANDTIAFFRSMEIKIRCDLFLCDTIAISTSATWHQQCCDGTFIIEWGATCLLVMWYNWCLHWHYMMPTSSSMAPLYSLGQGDWNEMQHDVLVMWPNRVV